MTGAILAAAILTLPGGATQPPTDLATRLRTQLQLARADAQRERRLRGQLARRHTRLRNRYRSVLRTNPDVQVAATLAGLAYGQDPAALIRCARSEGLPKTGSHDLAREVHVTNHQGSGATGPWQFMPGTFAGTPQGRAGLSIWRVDVQAHAAAWMWSQGRRGEWTGAGC